jgi:hypothetical protein
MSSRGKYAAAGRARQKSTRARELQPPPEISCPRVPLALLFRRRRSTGAMSGGSATPPTPPFSDAPAAAAGAIPPPQIHTPAAVAAASNPNLAVVRGQMFAPPRRGTLEMSAPPPAPTQKPKARQPKRPAPPAGGAPPRPKTSKVAAGKHGKPPAAEQYQAPLSPPPPPRPLARMKFSDAHNKSGHERMDRSLRSQWGVISLECQKWSAMLSSVDKLNPSGTNDKDWVISFIPCYSYFLFVLNFFYFLLFLFLSNYLLYV